MYHCIVIFLGQCIDTFKFCIVPSLLLAWYGPFVLSPVFLAVLEGKHGKIKFAILEHRHPHFHLTFAFGHEKLLCTACSRTGVKRFLNSLTRIV